MFLYRKYITSNASRIMYVLKFNIKQLKLSFNFFSAPKLKRGRSLYNGKVIRTKKSIKKTKQINATLSFKNLKSIYYTVALCKFGRTSKVFMFCRSFGGLFHVLPKLSRINLFQVFFINPFTKFRFKSINNIVLSLLLVKKYVFVSYLENFTGCRAAFVRAPGSKAFFLTRNKALQMCLIELPSKAKKYFPLSLFCLAGSVETSRKVKTWTTKSGYYRNFGVNTVSRGVARNPVDHPNGGRTKALKCPKTPWGLIAKRK